MSVRFNGSCVSGGSRIANEPENEYRMSGAVDQAAFEKVMRDNHWPEDARSLQPTGSIRTTKPEGDQAIDQLLRFRYTAAGRLKSKLSLQSCSLVISSP
jgi:hypothetical protein